MFNLLKSDGYRLVHGKMLWVATAVFVGAIVAVAALMHLVSDPQFLYDSAQMSVTMEVGDGDVAAEDAQDAAAAQAAALEAAEVSSGRGEGAALGGAWDDEGESAYGVFLENPDGMALADFEGISRDMRTVDSPVAMFGDMLLSGGLLGGLVGLVVALFFASDFSTRFVRNLPMDRRGRTTYYLERLVLVALVALGFLVVGCLVSLAAIVAAGFVFTEMDTVGDLAVFLGLSWLCLTAYGCLTAVVVWMSRSAGVGIAFALLVATGIVGSVVGALLENLGMAMPMLATLVPWMLSSCTNTVTSLPVPALLAMPESASMLAISPAVQVAIVGAFWVAVSAAVSLGVLRKRDV